MGKQKNVPAYVIVKCPDCNYAPSSQYKFMEHRRVHTGEKPHACHLCQYRTAQKSHLTFHLKNTHRNHPQNGFTTTSSNNTSSSDSFPQTKGLKGHHNRYNTSKQFSSKSFVCPFPDCGYETSRKAMATRHKRYAHRNFRPKSSDAKTKSTTRSATQPYDGPLKLIKTYERMKTEENPSAQSTTTTATITSSAPVVVVKAEEVDEKPDSQEMDTQQLFPNFGVKEEPDENQDPDVSSGVTAEGIVYLSIRL